MDDGPPAWVTDAKSRMEWMRTIPGVIVHHNPDPNPRPFRSDIWVNEGVTVDDILGYDDDDETDGDR